MKPIGWIIFGAGLLAALGAGFGARRLMTADAPAGEQPAAPAMRPAAGPPAPETNPAERALTEEMVRILMAATASTRSGDSLETILKIDPVAEYGRLALWMLDAGPDDIAAYWDHYRARPNRSNDINDLIFINWARIDPEAAVAKSAGTPDEHYAWWAWGCHDPATALAEVQARNPDRINNVTWALGEFHAEWAREHFEEIPEAYRDNVFRGMVKWDDAADPALILDFMAEQGRGTDARMFKSLVRKDPWAAYDRVIESGGKDSMAYGGDHPMDLLISNMAEIHPDLLERMAQLTRPGELKRKMEASAFDSLLQKEPAEAIRQAMEEKAPAIAAERLAKTGAALLETDPDRAFDMAERIFDLPRAAWSGEVRIDNENGYQSRGGSSVGGEFLTGLVARDPRRTMEVAMASGESSPRAVERVAGLWANQDLYGFSEWVSAQQPSESRSAAAELLVHRLSNDGMHADAMAWCASEERLRPHLQRLFQQWHQNDPAAAREWAASAVLPESERKQIEQILKR